MTAMEEEVDDRFAGIDIDSLLNRTDHRPLSYGRKKALYEAPEFIQRLNGEETVLEGQSLCIECKVRGFPVPTLRWFKDDEQILDHPRIHVESTGTGGYSLIIDNVHKGDEAAYRCRAENLEGACSSFFFLSVKSKPKTQKKKDQKSSPNRRTVSFPPMFATIVEKVEEEEKQGEELQKLPPSPMTDFYYALTLKGRQSWPTFLGDWAFTNGGHSHNRRTDDGDDDDDDDSVRTHSASATPASVTNGDHNDPNFQSTNQARLAARRSLRRSELAARAESKKQRLDEDALKHGKTNGEKVMEDESEKRRLEEERKKKEDEMNMDIERKRRAETMRLRKKAREERLLRERSEQDEGTTKQDEEAVERKKKEEERLHIEKQQREEQRRKEEEIRKKEEQKNAEEMKRKEEEMKKHELEKREKDDNAGKKREEVRKKKEAEETARIQEELEKQKRRQVEERNKHEFEETRRKLEEDRKKQETKQMEEKELKKKNEVLLKAEEERKKKNEVLLKAEEERKKKNEVLLKAEEERKKKNEVLLKAEEERKKKNEVLLKAEEERKKKNEVLLKAEEERKKKNEVLLKAEEERKKKNEVLLKAEEERKKKNEVLLKAEEERKKKNEVLLKAEEERKKKNEVLLKAEEERKKKNEVLLKAEEERKKLQAKKQEEEKTRLENERKTKELSKAQNEPQQVKPSVQKSVLQKFAKHLDPKLETNIAPAQKASPVLRPSSERTPISNQPGIITSVDQIPKDKSPLPSRGASTENTNQHPTRQDHTIDKKPDIPKDTIRSKTEENEGDGSKLGQNNLRESNIVSLRPWQQRDRLVQKQEVYQDKRLEEMRQKDKKREEELKQQEQKRLEELKQGHKNFPERLRGRDQSLTDLKAREQKQIEELRRKEQMQIDELRQKEQKQLNELHRKQEQQREEMKLKGELKRREDITRKEDIKIKEDIKYKEEMKIKEEIKRREEMKLKEEIKRKEEMKVKEELRLKEDKKRKEDMKLREEMKRQEELKLKEELKRKEDMKLREEMKRKEEIKRREEFKLKEEIKQKEEMKLKEEMKRKEETRLKEEMKRKEEIKLKEEMKRKEEIKLKEEMKRKEEIKLKEEMKRKEEIKLKEEMKQKEEMKLREEIKRKEEMKLKEDLKRKNEITLANDNKVNLKWKPSDLKHRNDMKEKETNQLKDLRTKEQKQREELKLKEEKQLRDLPLKQQPQQARWQDRVTESERKRKEDKEQEDLRMECKKEQMIKDQLWRLHEEEVEKRRQKEEEQRQRNRQEKQSQLNSGGDDEFEVKVHKRDYSFVDLRKGLETHVIGKAKGQEEHKYMDEILQKHDYSINKLQKTFDTTASSSTERQSRSRNRGNSIEDTDLERMKRSGSVTGICQSFTNSLDRPQRRAESQTREKDEEFLKRGATINEIRQQFLEASKGHTDSKKTQNLPGHREADITIHRLKVDTPLSHHEGPRRSKSPTPFRLSPSPSPLSSSHAEQPQDPRPVTRTQVELSKIASSVAAKRASFHELLNQNRGPHEKGVPSEASHKRMSYQGRDSYGSKEIPTYKRAAGWLDDIDKPQGGLNPSQLQPSETAKTSASLDNASATLSIRNNAEDATDLDSCPSKVRPFIYNSARTIARNSTGSITMDSCEYSSDDDVFDEQNDDIHIDEDDEEVNERPPGKAPIFYLEDLPDTEESEAPPTSSIIVFNSKLCTGSRGQGQEAIEAEIQNEQNNNKSIPGHEVMDNEVQVTELNTSGIDNLPFTSLAQVSKNEVSGKTKKEKTEVANENADNTKEKRAESVDHVKLISGEVSDTKSHVEAKHETKITPLKDFGDTRNLVTGNEISYINTSSKCRMVDDERDRTRTTSNATTLTPVSDVSRSITPPIVIELWEESEAPGSLVKHPIHSDILQQSSLLSTEEKINSTPTTAGYSREEREPTPYFPSDDVKSKHIQYSYSVGAGSDCNAAAYEDYSRTEREPTPYFDEKSKLRNSSSASGTLEHRPSKFLSPETTQEFQREPTPFFESRNKSTPAVVEASTDLSGVTCESFRPSRELTPFYAVFNSKSNNLTNEKSNMLSVPASLVVSPFAEITRDARESTPYYKENDPYEYIHHPDHHFSEKKSALIKQNSNDEEVPSEEQFSLLSVQPHFPLPPSCDKHQALKSKFQERPTSNLTLGVAVKPTTDNKTQQPTKPGLRATELGQSSVMRSRNSDPASRATRTVELQHGASLSTVTSEKSQVLVLPQQPNTGKQPTTAYTSASNDIRHSNNTNTPHQIKEQAFSRTDKKGSKDTVKLSNQLLDKPTPTDTRSVSEKKSSPASTKLEANASYESRTKRVDDVKKRAMPPAALSTPSTELSQPSLNVQNEMEKSCITPTLLPSTQNRASADQLPLFASQKPETSSQILSQPSKQSQNTSDASEVSKQAVEASEAQNGNQQYGKKLTTETDQQKQTIITSAGQGKLTHASGQQTVPGLSVKASSRSLAGLGDALTTPTVFDTIINKDAPLAAKVAVEAKHKPFPTVKPEIKGHAMMASQNTTSLAHAAVTGTVNDPSRGSTSHSIKVQETRQDNVLPRQLIVSAKNIYPVEIFTEESSTQVSGTPPAATALKKKSLASGISSAFSTIFKSKRNADDQKESTSVKEKTKKNMFTKGGRKKKSRTITPEPASPENMQSQQVRQVLVSSQILAKCSPFGSYTLEGFCCLFVMTVFCLHIEMPIEKFVCYVLATFYTFCVMRILGIIT